jgi:putative acetyltransferase
MASASAARNRGDDRGQDLYPPIMEIREERPADHELVREILQRAFGDHGLLVADLVESLRETIPRDGGLSLVAAHEGQLAGHVMFTRSLLDAPERLVDVQVLSPLGVLPEFHRRGIGTALVRQGLAMLDERFVPLVFLEGDPGYYARFGFVPGGESGFRRPSLRIPERAFQVLALSAYEAWMTGTLVYSEPFWQHDAVGLRDS